MSQRLLPIVVLAVFASTSWCTRAHAERPVRVVANGAPFAAEDLATALRVRLPVDGSPVDVNVIASVGDLLTVSIGDASRQVALEGRSGPTAARLVALAIVDLALEDLAEVPRDEPPPPRSFAVTMVGSASAWTGVLAGGSAELAVRRGGWVGALEIGAGQEVTGELHVTTIPVRLTGGIRIDRFELRGGVELVSSWVSDGLGDQLTMFGLAATARLHLGGRFVLAAGADAYTTQTTYMLGATRITTPWIAPWVGVGVELLP